MSKSTSGAVITVDSISKDFVLNQDHVNSLKATFVRALRRKKGAVNVHHALNDICFEVKKGEFFGIVGRNGSGKSTLLKILAGIYQPTKGKVSTYGKLVPFIELGVGFNPELTGRENVYLNGAMLGFSKSEVDDMYENIVAFAELEEYMDQKLKNYSSGMQVRLAFSMATRSKADILLVDEVLAVGDADFQRKCFNYFKSLKKSKVTVVFVTHDMGAVREYCDRAIMIEDSKIVATDTAEKIASKYIKLFQVQNVDYNEEDDEDSEKSKRWGDGIARVKEITFTKRTLKDGDEVLKFSISAKAEKSLDAIVLGFTIRDSTGKAILGTNTLLKNKKISNIVPNEIVSTEWTIPNIFREGDYTLDVAVNHDNGIDVHDWWEEATTFHVYNSDYSQYIVHPPMAVEVMRTTGK